jgi:hypothetical protein
MGFYPMYWPSEDARAVTISQKKRLKTINDEDEE